MLCELLPLNILDFDFKFEDLFEFKFFLFAAI
jgi:hypothetical protein